MWFITNFGNYARRSFTIKKYNEISYNAMFVTIEVKILTKIIIIVHSSDSGCLLLLFFLA